jgi:hypothetical protein
MVDGIRLIKLYGIETAFALVINNLREKELDKISWI